MCSTLVSLFIFVTYLSEIRFFAYDVAMKIQSVYSAYNGDYMKLNYTLQNYKIFTRYKITNESCTYPPLLAVYNTGFFQHLLFDLIPVKVAPYGFVQLQPDL